MDAIDQKLIERLQANARESLSSLSRELGISRSTLQDRMGRLESKGIIEGYTIRLNRDVDGSRIRAQLLLQIEPNRNAEIVEALAKFPSIKTLLAVSGVFDLMAQLEAQDTESLDKLVDQIGAVNGVKKTQTLIIFSTKFNR